MRRLLRLEILILLCIMAGVSVFYACHKKQKVYLGYVGNLTGRTSELGMEGRNGAVLAVNEANRQGGVNGREIELLIRDNLGRGETAELMTRNLVDVGVVAIVGHMLSQMSVAAMPALDDSPVVMVSPTTATSALNERDDQFLRINPDLRKLTVRLARYAYRERGVRRMAVIANSDNNAFSEPWVESFSIFFAQEGGQVVSRRDFADAQDKALEATVSHALKARPDGLLIVASAPDTGLLCQQLRKLGSQIPVFTSEWSFAGDLLRYGGGSVEGVTLFHSFDPSARGSAYERFRVEYRDTFNRDPGFAAVNSYDAVNLILQGLRQMRPGESLKQALLSQQSFQGLQVAIQLDRFGDIERPLFLTRIVNGEFKRVTQP